MDMPTSDFAFSRISMELFVLEGTVQRDFSPPLFSVVDSSQASYSVFKDFSILASNAMRYSQFFLLTLRYYL
jgi:hypothetical protein